MAKATTRKGAGAGEGEELLTVRQAAARYGLNPKTIRKWIAADLLATVRIGPHRRIRVRADDLERRT